MATFSPNPLSYLELPADPSCMALAAPLLPRAPAAPAGRAVLGVALGAYVPCPGSSESSVPRSTEALGSLREESTHALRLF